MRRTPRTAIVTLATVAVVLIGTAGTTPATTPATASAAAPRRDVTTDGYLDEALRQVNAVRAKHHAPPLTLDPELTAYAKSRADTVSRGEQLSRGHDDLRPGTGENLYWSAASDGVGSPTSAAEAVKVWYDELKDYDFARPGFSPRTGHLTQLVWKKTARLGAARVQREGPHGQETWTSFAFEAPGNVRGHYKENVLPAS
ncbi:CAP family protein [Streptomyces sp. H27-D2]|uniref:CAP family protein n=1 Tax=Streptomyces sp. H27-D2 TaxID=3046304 RepID=UPI002DBB7F90|nr:CAP family protein [Streptomyces sp. H27-D2]MEC4016001.1 CAP family protein [Streptomyces sp. H27-D2]